MIYFLLVISLALNGVLVWYIRKILTKYWYDVEARKSFSEMLSRYEEALMAIYKLEEFYGEETLKKAINQTKFVIQACEEFKEILEKDTIQEEDDEEEANQETFEEEDNKKENAIYLKEGEKVTQDATNYKRVIREQA